MLISFSVQNYLSFKDKTTFSMIGTKKLTEQTGNLIDFEGTSLLKSAVIYGPNASGKTNLLVALHRLAGIVVNSFKETQTGEKLPIEPFLLNEQTRNQPTAFDISFENEGTFFDYSVSFTNEKIYNETLSIDGQNIFSRAFKDIDIQDNDYVGAAALEKRIDFVRENSLFVSVLGATNVSQMKLFIDFFQNKFRLFTAAERMPEAYTSDLIEENPNLKAEILKIIKNIDFGIQGVENKLVTPDIPDFFKELPDEIITEFKQGRNRLHTSHNIYREDGSVVEQKQFIADRFESSGTKSFLAFIGPIVDTMVNGKVLFIDELDALLHPVMSNYLVKLINNSKLNNGGQVVFTTHNTNLLDSDILRRDQIFFVEKDKLEQSHLESLVQYKTEQGKKIRKDENFEKNYLSGKYGAIPVIKRDL